MFDIEANGLEATQIWCVVAKDIDTKEVYVYHVNNSFSGIYEMFTQADELIGHNIIEYDLPLLSRIFGISPKTGAKVTDTLVLSRVLNPDRRSPIGLKGGHSLETWGKVLGMHKKVHEDWSKFSTDMLERCISDVHITHLLLDYLKREESQYKNWSSAIDLEHRVATIISKQARSGIMFDIKKAKELYETLNNKIKEIDEYLLRFLPKSYIKIGVPVNKPFKIDGTYSKMVTDYYEDPTIVSGPFSRIKWEEFNINSEPQIKEFLLKNGWEPTEWNYVKEKNGTYRRSSPKLTEDSFGSINGDIPAKVKERLLVAHRSSTLMSMRDPTKGWINNVRVDGTLPASANPCGTNTCRMTHSVVVNVPKASARIPYGKEMRALFIPRPGRVLVGHDAEQLELRMLAHYMNDYLYTQELLNGDIHSYNQKLAGLSTRDEAKTFIYAFIYGAGDEKLGTIVGGGKREGSEIRRKFMLENPNLAQLIDRTKARARSGFLVGLDGRKIWMRKDEQGSILTHKALNTLLQSAGAIVMKRAMVILDSDITANRLDSIKVIDMHDESQYDVHPKSVNKHMELAKASIVKAGEYYNLNIPLSASVKKGNNWSETH